MVVEIHCSRCENPLDYEPAEDTTEFAVGPAGYQVHGDLCVSCTKDFYQFLEEKPQ